MRPDMKHVLIERPRRGGGGKFPRATARRRPGQDHENARLQEGMSRAHRDRKSFSDLLSPLRRYLAKQVGRPWNKVWSEVCQGVDRRSLTGMHLISHVGAIVERHVRVIDGKPHALWVNEWAPLGRFREDLYVDPRDGLLKKAKPRRKA